MEFMQVYTQIDFFDFLNNMMQYSLSVGVV